VEEKFMDVPACSLRAEAAYLGREVGSIGKTEAAKYMGRDRSTMSLAVKRLEEGLERDPQPRHQLEDCCATEAREKAHLSRFPKGACEQRMPGYDCHALLRSRELVWTNCLF